MKQKVKSKAKIKRTERIVALSLVAVFLLTVLLSRVIYREYILRTPPEMDFPRSFSRPLFDFKNSAVKEITVFFRGEYDENGRCHIRSVDIDTPEQIHEMAEHIKSFRYHFWMPGPLQKEMNQGEANALTYVTVALSYGPDIFFRYNDHGLLANRVWYYGDKEFFEKLTDLAEQLGHPRGG